MSDRWLKAFRQDPQKVSDLFTGRAGVGSDMRLEVPELLRLRFPPTLTEERAQLDDALLAWLLEMRESYTCLRLLTQGQPDARHTAMWQRLAADQRAEYRTVGLAGLRLAPSGHTVLPRQAG